jgi:HD-like signal output (HDOD) protein
MCNFGEVVPLHQESKVRIGQHAALRLLKNVSAPDAPSDPVLDLRGRFFDAVPELDRPDSLSRILELFGTDVPPSAAVARALESDEDLCHDALRVVSSPLFSEQLGVTSIRRAIAHFGQEMMIGLGAGLSVLGALRGVEEGSLGRRAVLNHAFLSASLVSRLSTREIDGGHATRVFAGFVHGVGLLVLGHAFAAEHRLLGRLHLANPGIPLQSLSRYATGIDYLQLGICLGQLWSLPEGVRVVLAEHCNPDYQGPYMEAVAVAFAANRLLRRQGIGFGSDTELRWTVLGALDVDADQLEPLAASIAARSAACDRLISGLRLA